MQPASVQDHAARRSDTGIAPSPIRRRLLGQRSVREHRVAVGFRLLNQQLRKPSSDRESSALARFRVSIVYIKATAPNAVRDITCARFVPGDVAFRRMQAFNSSRTSEQSSSFP